MANILTKFLTNMLLSGIITQKEGINYLWHNPFVFYPTSSFAVFYTELKNSIGDEADELFFWIGYLQGINSTSILMKRFGYKDIHELIDGATLIGMGDLKVLKETKDHSLTVFDSKNSTHALKVKSIIGNTKTNIDHYICGILSGGGEILFNNTYFRCYEPECMAKGDDRCLYEVKYVNKITYNIIGKRIKEFDSIIKKINKLYLTKKPFTRISIDKKFDVKDGAFYFNKYQGYNIEAYLVLILDLYLTKYHKNKYEQVLEKMFRENLKVLFKDETYKLSQRDISLVLEKIKLFGFGNIQFKHLLKNKLFLESNNTVLSNEHRQMIGKNYTDKFIVVFLRVLFKDIFLVDVKVEETNCIGLNSKSCVFKISY